MQLLFVCSYFNWPAVNTHCGSDVVTGSLFTHVQGNSQLYKMKPLRKGDGDLTESDIQLNKMSETGIYDDGLQETYSAFILYTVLKLH